MKGSITFLVLMGWIFSGTAFCQTPIGFFTEGHIPEIHITLRTDGWSEKLDSLRLYGQEMVIGTAEIEKQHYPNVGIRYRGEATMAFQGKKNPFVIQLDHLHPDQHHQGYRSFVLSNAFRDPSYLREYLGFNIARQYMEAPQANFAKVYINGDYKGLFIAIEPVDAAFLDKRLPGQWKALFGCGGSSAEKNAAKSGCRKGLAGNLGFEESEGCYRHNYTLLSGMDAWSQLVELTRILEQEPVKIESVLDVDAALWMLAFNNVLANLNSYSGRSTSTYYMYQGSDGRFVPVVWDLNLAFGSHKNTGVGSDISQKDLEKMSPYLHEDNPLKPLIQQLLKQDLYRKIYNHHLLQIIQDNFKEDAFTKKALELKSLITPLVTTDPGKSYTMDEFNKSLDKTIGTRTKIPGLSSFMETRTTYLRKSGIPRFKSPVFASVDLQKRPKFDNQEVSDFQFTVITENQARVVRLYYRFSDQGAFKSVLMEPSPHEGLASGQDRFSIRVTPEAGNTTIQYYLMVESLSAVSFHPVHYQKEKLTASLSELN